MTDLEYLEQAEAHADEGPLGEPAARDILKIALRLKKERDILKALLAGALDLAQGFIPEPEPEELPTITRARAILKKTRSALGTVPS